MADIPITPPSYRLVKIRDVLQNPLFNPQEFEDIIDHFETRESDIFVCTYVKSGTTWTQQIIHQILRRGQPGGSYNETVPWLEALSSNILSSREAPTWTIEKINNNLSTRYFKTHAKVKDLPGINSNGTDGRRRHKVIYIARNPKDVAISLYHHAKNKPEFEFSYDFNTFLNLFLNGEVESNSWFDHVQEWWLECQKYPSDQYMFLFYEDICQNPLEIVQKIASFIGINDLTPEEYELILQNISIDAMKSSSTSNIGFHHLRKGGYGNWRNVFTVAQNELFDTIYLEKMKSTPELKFNFGCHRMTGEDLIM